MPGRIGPGGPWLQPQKLGDSSPPRPFAQYDWPNPTDYKKGAAAPEHHSLASTATNTKPFNPPDWVTPVKNFALAAIMGFAAQNLLATTLAPQQGPFKNTDFPNPQSKAGTVALLPFAQNILISTLAQPLQPFKQTEWPNPSLRSQPLQDWSYSVTRLLPTVATPFAQFDWPNPGVKSFVAGEHHALASTATNVKPFVPIEWTNPKQQPGFWDWSYSVTAILPVTQRPFSQTDWPLPDHKQSPSLEHFNRTAVGTPPVLGVPFKSIDWPNPQSKGTFKHTQAFRPPPDLAGAPFSQSDWPNPAIIKRPVQDWQYSILNSTLAIVPPRPFKQLDWANPNVRRQPLQDWNYSVTAGLPVGTRPFAQTDWPLPSVRKQPLQDWQYTVTALLPVSGTPFFPIDWPNPASKGTFKHTQAYRPPADIDRTPFNQDDWPNPNVRRQPVQDWQYSVTARLPVGATPFSQTDWPNPNVRKQPLQDWIYTVTATLPVGATPFSQSDWPNPNVRSQALQAWDYSTNFLLPVGDTPFAQTDWPNPGKARSFVYLFEPPNLLTSTLAAPGAAPPNLHRLVMDIETGRLGWMVSGTHAGTPILVVFLD